MNRVLKKTMIETTEEKEMATVRSEKNLYEYFKANPPVDANGRRKRGNSMQDGYWTGYDFPDRTPRGAAGSNARLAWKAGKLAAKLREL